MKAVTQLADYLGQYDCESNLLVTADEADTEKRKYLLALQCNRMSKMWQSGAGLAALSAEI